MGPRNTPDSERSAASLLEDIHSSNPIFTPPDAEIEIESQLLPLGPPSQEVIPAPQASTSTGKRTPRCNLNPLSGRRASGSKSTTPTWMNDYIMSKEHGQLEVLFVLDTGKLMV